MVTIMELQRIIVADDEEVQREGLGRIIKKLVPKVEVICCCNGIEVCEVLQKSTAEILITDICMPFMDGMELISKVSKEYPSMKVVLISAYQEFEYARNAIRCGVSEYMIKPFRVGDVRNLLDKISKELLKETEKDRRLNHYDTLIQQSQKKEMQENLIELILGRRKPEMLLGEEYCRLRTPGTIAILRWKVKRGEHRQQEQLLKRIYFTFNDCVHVITEQGIDKSVQQIILFLPSNTSLEAAYYMENMLNEVRKEGFLFWTGISNSKQDLLEQVIEGVRQAEEVLAFYFYFAKEGGIFVYEKLNHVLEKPMISVSSFEKAIRQAVCKGDKDGVEREIKHLGKSLHKEPFYYPNKVKHRVSSMMVGILKELEGAVTQTEYDQLLNEAYELYSSCDSFESLFQISQELLFKASHFFMNSVDEYDVIESCISYIKAHLDEELSLQTIADKIHFHPNYLSAQIKMRLGMSYSGYLLSLRMDAACKYLKETDYKVADIGSRCGFKDNSYFNRVFRKEHEMSPEQYRKIYKYINRSTND